MYNLTDQPGGLVTFDIPIVESDNDQVVYPTNPSKRLSNPLELCIHRVQPHFTIQRTLECSRKAMVDLNALKLCQHLRIAVAILVIS